MKAKRIVAFLALLAMLFTLAACNSSTTPPADSGTNPPADSGNTPAKEMTIKYWSNFGASGNCFDYLEYVKAGFEKENEELQQSQKIALSLEAEEEQHALEEGKAAQETQAQEQERAEDEPTDEPAAEAADEPTGEDAGQEEESSEQA